MKTKFFIQNIYFITTSFATCFLLYFSLTAQIKKNKLSQKEISYFQEQTKHLVRLRHLTDSSKNPEKRFKSDSLFVLELKKTLLKRNSYYYPFEELEGVFVLPSLDYKFKIFTWQYTYDKMRYYHHGVIQLNPKRKKISKIIPLYDQSNYIRNTEDRILFDTNWIGCNYYFCKIFSTPRNKKKYYILFGFDANNIRSNKKWIEVLSIEKDGKIRFGAPIFYFIDSLRNQTKIKNRFSIEFHDYSNGILRYDSELDLIIFDNLVSISEERKTYTQTMSGSYNAFKWDVDKFIYIKDVFSSSRNSLLSPELPVDKPITSDGVNFDPKFIRKQNQKNLRKRK